MVALAVLVLQAPIVWYYADRFPQWAVRAYAVAIVLCVAVNTYAWFLNRHAERLRRGSEGP